MVDADFQQADFYQQLAEQLRETQNAIVHQLDLNDESFSAAMRGKELEFSSNHEFLETLFKEESSLLKSLLSSAETFEQGVAITDSLIRHRLEEIAKTLEDSELQQRYLDPRLSLRELGEVIQFATPKQRLELLQEIATLATVDKEVYEFVRARWDNLLYHTSPDKRVSLINSVLELAPSSAVHQQIVHTLRASQSLEELQNIVFSVGYERLAELEHPEINEYLAHVQITSAVRDLDFSFPADSNDPDDLLGRLYDRYDAVVDICSSFPELQNTTVVDDYLHTVSENLNQLGIELASATTEQEKLERLEVFYRTAELEFRYGVSITVGDSQFLGLLANEGCRASEFGVDMNEVDLTDLLKKPQWTIDHLYDVERVLEAIPEGHLLFTPLLRDIKLVETLGYGVLGARYVDGRIKLSTLTLNLEQLSNNYEGESSLAIVLAHEIGHGVQIGSGPSGIYYPRGGDPFFGAGEAILDFNEWMEISQWTVYQRERYQVDSQSRSVILDGVRLPLGVPVTFGGEEIVLQHNPWGNVLTSYRADSEFSNRWYAKTSPWEDFAEAFSEYLFLPERLIQDAPNKFLHLELEYRRYSGNLEMMELLEEALANSTGPESHGAGCGCGGH